MIVIIVIIVSRVAGFGSRGDEYVED